MPGLHLNFIFNFSATLLFWFPLCLRYHCNRAKRKKKKHNNSCLHFHHCTMFSNKMISILIFQIPPLGNCSELLYFGLEYKKDSVGKNELLFISDSSSTNKLKRLNTAKRKSCILKINFTFEQYISHLLFENSTNLKMFV